MPDNATTNWPNPERPGVPMFPERDGWHWLSNRPNDDPFPAEWSHEDYCNAETEWSWDMGEEREDAYEMKGLYYHGPCLTPTQISEMLAGERERCATACDKLADDFLPCHPSEYAREIRNLGAAS
ncbi:hypothetical protein [Acetobacter malorum]|uniref:Uncharacterized protein n=1 Tax=Acetobacter malorum TaxID=178901 RepID=A0A1Y3GAK4_9PROT|nr:hypothetical protein [Acetobacter malorum]OUJ06617.1 hypothetical protein HK23_14120 [Acetobacter malorum]